MRERPTNRLDREKCAGRALLARVDKPFRETILVRSRKELLYEPLRGIAASLGLFLAAGLSMFVMEEFIGAIVPSPDHRIKSISEFGGFLTATILGILLYKRHFASNRQISSSGKRWWILAAALGGFAFFLSFLGLINFVEPSQQKYHLTQSKQFAESAAALSGFALALKMATYNLTAPILEEVIFRGIIFRSLQAGYGVTVAGTLSAALFASTHLASNIEFIVPLAFCFGATSAFLLHRSSRLAACVLFHSVYNILITAYTFWVASL